MKTYRITVCTKFYKVIEIEADSQENAEVKAWEYAGNNDILHNADIDTDFYDIEEVAA